MKIRITQGIDKAREAAEIRTEVFINEQGFNTNHSLNYGNLSPQKPYIKAFAAISSP